MCSFPCLAATAAEPGVLACSAERSLHAMQKEGRDPFALHDDAIVQLAASRAEHLPSSATQTRRDLLRGE